MRYAIWTIVALTGVIGVVATVGWLLPVGHVASRTAAVSAAPEAVYEIVRDVAKYPAWRSDVKQVEVLASEAGKIRFREHSSTGAITMEMVEATPPARIVTRIADPDQSFGGTWTFEIARAPTGSTITITERGEVYNPIFRFVARFVLGYYGTLDSYLQDLARRVNEPARL